MVTYKRPIIAFVHIGKTGGTTLIHILRHNFLLQSIDVRPLSKDSRGVFSADDLRKTLRLNPFIKCISGHSIRAFSNLVDLIPHVRYLTVLRNPVDRCISQYQQRIMKYGEIPFPEFLSRDWLPNLQTKFIAGSDDLEMAKEILATKFFLVGVLDEFDTFLTILSKKLGAGKFDPSYKVIRVAKDTNRKNEILERYEEQIVDAHELDIELYNFVKSRLLEREKSAYGPSLEIDLAAQKRRNNIWSPPQVNLLLDYAIRKYYYEPVTGLIRRMNGMPAKGYR